MPPWHIPADTNSLARLAPFSRKKEETVHTFSFLFKWKPTIWLFVKNDKWQEPVLTQSRVGDTIHLQDEVVFEENVANNGEQVDQDESQDSGEHDRASVAGHTLDYIQQCLFPVYQVEQLQR